MKVALLITAFNEIDFLYDLVEDYSKEFNVYIHIDQKTECDLARFNELDNVRAISKYKINWGSVHHVDAIIALMKMAMADGCEYVSVISANTVPTASLESVKTFFENNRDKIFLEHEAREGDYHFHDFDYRFSAYFFQHIYNLRGPLWKFWRSLEKISALLQRKLGLRKNVVFKYKGYVYCHLPQYAVEYVLRYINSNPHYLTDIKYCWVGEEFFFQNILIGSSLDNAIVNDCLMYDIWSEDRGYPAFLNVSDLDEIVSSGKLFCRKVSSNDRELYFGYLRRIVSAKI